MICSESADIRVFNVRRRLKVGCKASTPLESERNVALDVTALLRFGRKRDMVPARIVPEHLRSCMRSLTDL
jgi:hypothetical protein